MANVIPIAVTIFAIFVVFGAPSDASECMINNIGILSQLIDERINATVGVIVAEVTAALEESIAASVTATLSVIVDDKIATINTTVSAVNTAVSTLSATVDDKISAVNTTVRDLSATVDERITTVRTTVGAHDVSIAKLLRQPGKFVVTSSPGPLPG